MIARVTARTATIVARRTSCSSSSGAAEVSSSADHPRERVCLITGSTDGIGLHTATRLASQQQPRSFDRIIVHGRSEQVRECE